MKRTTQRIWRSIPALSIVALVALASSSCRDQDVLTFSFANMSEVRAAGAEAQDIPRWIPEGAHDLRAAHDPDTHRRWGLFNFLPQDADALRARMTPEEVPLAGLECDIPGRIEWWPILLRGPVNAEQAQVAGLQAYRSLEGGLIFVVHWKQGRAYYWGS
jgi:hypothetical protein